MTRLVAAPLTQAAFAEFGDVIEATGKSERINSNTVSKYADRTHIDLSNNDGRPSIHIYHADPYATPIRIGMLERHPLSSQLFMPIDKNPFLVVVAAPGDEVNPGHVRAFVSNGQQGVNYHAGTWHHPVIAIGEKTALLVLDRVGPEKNCDEIYFDDESAVNVDLP